MEALSGRVHVVGAGAVGPDLRGAAGRGRGAVDVLARDLPLETTSAVAGALWLPYRAEPVARRQPGAAITFRVLAELAGDPGTVVRMMPGLLLAATVAPDPPVGGTTARHRAAAARARPGAGAPGRLEPHRPAGADDGLPAVPGAPAGRRGRHPDPDVAVGAAGPRDGGQLHRVVRTRAGT